MITPRYDANGVLSFLFVVPTKSLRTLIHNYLRRTYKDLNYCCEWKDTRGWGIMMSVASWSKGMYHVPPSERIYTSLPSY